MNKPRTTRKCLNCIVFLLAAALTPAAFATHFADIASVTQPDTNKTAFAVQYRCIYSSTYGNCKISIDGVSVTVASAYLTTITLDYGSGTHEIILTSTDVTGYGARGLLIYATASDTASITISPPAVRTTTYTYDVFGRLEQVTSEDAISTYGYDSADNRVSNSTVSQNQYPLRVAWPSAARTLWQRQ